jgi:hypothetical protein
MEHSQLGWGENVERVDNRGLSQWGNSPPTRVSSNSLPIHLDLRVLTNELRVDSIRSSEDSASGVVINVLRRGDTPGS